MSTSLDACTLAFATTAPELSFTTPAIELCAIAIEGNNISTTRLARTQSTHLALVISISYVDFQLRNNPATVKPFGYSYPFFLTISFDTAPDVLTQLGVLGRL